MYPFLLNMTKQDFEKFVEFLEKAEKEEFFGEITFKYRKGEIFLINKYMTLKPEDI